MKKMILSMLIVIAISTITIISIFVLNKEANDSIKFKQEYENINDKINEKLKKKYIKLNIDKKNPMIYATYDEIIDLIEEGTGIIYFGFPECPWCRSALPVLLDAAKELDIDKIYYFNALSLRDKKSLDEDGNILTEEKGTDEYKKIVNLLYSYLPVYEGLNDETIKRLYFPTVIFINEGNIVGIHTSTVTSQKDPYKKLNNNQYQELKNIYLDYINKVYDIFCDKTC